MKKKIYVSEYIDPKAREMLADACDIVDNFDHPEELDGILVRRLPVSGALMRQAPQLKVIAVHGVGVDNIDLEQAKIQGIQIITTPGANAQSVAELAVGFMLELSRRIKLVERSLEERSASRGNLSLLVGNELSRKKVGLIGTGHIGSRVGTILKQGFQCELYCYGRKSEEEYEAAGYRKIDTLEELFARMDLINISIPLNRETGNLVDGTLLAKANPRLLLVNTSRGGIVKEQDLYQALKTGQIAGAASDVFEAEPPAPDHPLLTLDNFIGTCHIGSNTEEALRKVGIQSVEGIFRVLGIENKS